MTTYLIQETRDLNCPAGCWTEINAQSWARACDVLTGIPAIEWRATDRPGIDLADGARVCRVQEYSELSGRWSQRWYATKFASTP